MGVKHVPSGLDSVGTTIPSFHMRNRSEIIGRKYHWISSGDCSLGPGRILVHMRFDVRYLENVNMYVKESAARRTEIQVAGCRLKTKWDTTSGMARCCYEYKKT
jgi:hypothetical protein